MILAGTCPTRRARCGRARAHTDMTMRVLNDSRRSRRNGQYWKVWRTCRSSGKPERTVKRPMLIATPGGLKVLPRQVLHAVPTLITTAPGARTDERLPAPHALERSRGEPGTNQVRQASASCLIRKIPQEADVTRRAPVVTAAEGTTRPTWRGGPGLRCGAPRGVHARGPCFRGVPGASRVPGGHHGGCPRGCTAG